MPITLHQKKANALYEDGWRSDKHLRSTQFNGRGRAGGLTPFVWIITRTLAETDLVV